VALISYGLWERRFGGNSKIVGRAISLDARPYTVVGVLPPHFEFPQADYDVWVTRPWEWSTVAPELWERVPDMWGVARLQPHATMRQAIAQLNVISREYALSHPGLPGADPHAIVHVERLEESLVHGLRSLLWMLFYAVGFVLLIVCANIAGLLLARSAARTREFAVRAALGAARGRLVQQMLVERVSLALIGSILGVLLAQAILSAMARFGPVDLPRADEIHIDGTVLAFAAVVSIIAGLVFGWLPSQRFSRHELADFLREQGTLAGRTSGRRGAFGFSARGSLVVAQIALCIVLLAGASLMLESFVRLRSVDPGFQPARLLTMEIALPTARYDTNQKKQAFWDELVQLVRTVPGVLNAAVAGTIPSTIPNMMVTQTQEQPRKDLNDRSVVNVQSGTPEYFHTLGIPVLEGRTFSERDRERTPRVAVIYE
jgi:putative ABC transport system permease protein